MALTYGSLFSGVGGADAGLDAAGMKCLWQCERDGDCLDVLRRHWPEVPKIDDVRKLRVLFEAKFHGRHGIPEPLRPDLIVGGFPCQNLSVAGRRAGLAGERSGLWYVFRRIIGLLHPTWVLIENVPGLLNSCAGRDMGIVLGGLGDSGYGWAYRVFNSEYFGVPQRRNRVFIVGYLGDARRAAQVLLEPDRLPWHSPKSRKTWPRITPPIAGCSNGGGANGPGRTADDAESLIVTHTHTQESRAAALTAREGKGPDSDCTTTLIVGKCEATRNGGRFDEREVSGPLGATGNGRGWNDDLDRAGAFIPVAGAPIDMRQASRGEKMTNNRREGSSGGAPGTGIGEEGDPAPTLGASHPPAVAFMANDYSSGSFVETDKSGAITQASDKSRGGPIIIEAGEAIAFVQNQRNEVRIVGKAGSLAAQPGMKQQTFIAVEDSAIPADPFVFQTRIARNGRGQPKDVVDTLTSSEGGSHADSKPHVATKRGVRRLMPIETERLQGFPDHHTAWGVDEEGQRVEMSDSARYRMTGNAISVPVSEWIGTKIAKVAHGNP